MITIRGKSIIIYIRICGAVLSIVAGIWIGISDPPPELTVEGMRALGIIAWAVGFWVVDIIPSYITGLLMCILWVLFKAAPFPKAFATFSSSTWWMILSAFALAVAASKTGLIHRIALIVLRLFSTSYKGQVIGFMMAGTIISPLIPSMNAKGALAAPIVHAVSKAMGIKDKSPAAAGLFGAMYVAFCLTGLIFISSAGANYLLFALIPPEAQVGMTWTKWFLNAFPWGIVVITGIALFVIKYYSPGDLKPVAPNYIKDELQNMGSMGRSEKITAFVICLALILWMTESFHHIDSGIVGVIAMCTLLGSNVMDRNDYKEKIDWAALTFIGSIMNMATIIQFLKLDKWFGAVLSPYLSVVLSNMYLYVIVIGILVYLIRFVFVSLTASSALIVLILAPLSMSFGVDPWIVVFTAYTFSGVFFLPYTSSMYLCAYYAVNGEMCDHKQTVPVSWAYAILCILGDLVCIPYWHFIGLIH